MTTNKNQHFVPRCYLRPFTLDEKGLAISLINIDRKKLIVNAPVKNQCSRDYFYGTDVRLESAIQSIEASYSGALRDLMRDKTFSHENQEIFRIFWLFQHLRTEAAATRAVEMAEATRNMADLPPEEFSLGIKEAVQMACRMFGEVMHVIDDLKFCVVKNKSKIPFIASDNPAVLTNMWHLGSKRLAAQSFGLGSAGMLAMLPLSPRYLLLGYDGDVYTVQKDRGVVEIKTARDAVAFNRHQFLHCVANVYIHDASLSEILIGNYCDIEGLRPPERYVIHYAQLAGVDGEGMRYVAVPREERDNAKEAIMHTQAIHPDPKIWPSKLKIRLDGAVYTNGTGLGYVRRSGTQGSAGPEFRRERPM